MTLYVTCSPFEVRPEGAAVSAANSSVRSADEEESLLASSPQSISRLVDPVVAEPPSPTNAVSSTDLSRMVVTCGPSSSTVTVNPPVAASPSLSVATKPKSSGVSSELEPWSRLPDSLNS